MLSGKQNHKFLLPAVRPGITKDYLPELPSYHFFQWIVGRGSVIRTVWPAVVVHSLFAAVIVVVWQHVDNPPVIPDLMLTVLGVVIGFVISYRAVSGYERYWQGRTAWSQIIITSRTLSRLIWVHVPPRFTPKTEDEIRSGQPHRSQRELVRAMAEKNMALDLVKAFAYALKHHMRGELGYFYEDLYDLVRPLHDHDHELDNVINPPKVIRRAHHITQDNVLARPASNSSLGRPSSYHSGSEIRKQPSVTREVSFGETVVDDSSDSSISPLSPPFGNGKGKQKHSLRRATTSSSGERQPLLSSSPPPSASEDREEHGLNQSQKQLIPFAGFFSRLFHWFKDKKEVESSRPDREHPAFKSSRKWVGPIHPKIGERKGAPRSGRSGENLPVEILRCLSEWLAVLEDRGTVPGGTLGSAMGCVASFEGCLTNLECILTTPLPFVYSAHIRQTVWIYLFLLPLQLVTTFKYYTILGTAIATFIYLGFLAAGEEIEQPFGYDPNDLDLDLFCREIIADEIDNLKSTPSLNVYIPSSSPGEGRRSTLSLVDSSKMDVRDGDLWGGEDST